MAKLKRLDFKLEQNLVVMKNNVELIKKSVCLIKKITRNGGDNEGSEHSPEYRTLTVKVNTTPLPWMLTKCANNCGIAQETEIHVGAAPDSVEWKRGFAQEKLFVW